MNHLFLRKKMVDFLPLVKLKCHDNFDRVINLFFGLLGCAHIEKKTAPDLVMRP